MLIKTHFLNSEIEKNALSTTVNSQRENVIEAYYNVNQSCNLACKFVMIIKFTVHRDVKLFSAE